MERKRVQPRPTEKFRHQEAWAVECTITSAPELFDEEWTLMTVDYCRDLQLWWIKQFLQPHSSYREAYYWAGSESTETSWQTTGSRGSSPAVQNSVLCLLL
jgi:hypothetical protein